MKDFLIITAFYDTGNTFRRRNLAASITHNLEVFPEADICIGEQNCSEWFKAQKFPVRHVFIDDAGPFKKTPLLNKCVSGNPGYKAYIMVDADVIITAEVVKFIKENYDKASLVFPYGNAIYMTEVDTRRLIAHQNLLPGNKDHGVVIDRQTGLCNVFTWDTYQKVGGFDESFTDWGAEDDAFVVKCKRLVGPIKRNRDESAIAYHMFHPIVNTTDYLKHSPVYLKNRVRCACIRRMSDEDLHAYVSKERTLEELITKYDALGRLQVKLEWPCTPRAGLYIDTTIYDIDRTGEMSFTKVMAAIELEDDTKYCIEFIDDVLLKIPDLNKEQRDEINGLRQYFVEKVNKNAVQ